MNLMRHKWSIVLPLVILLLMGAGFYFFQHDTPLYGVDQSKSIEVSRSSSGGLSGKGDGRVLTISRDQLTSKNKKLADKKRALSNKEQADLKYRIEQADFFNLAPSYFGGCRDSFTTTIAVTIKPKAHSVTFDDCGTSKAPSQLLELNKYLYNLSN